MLTKFSKSLYYCASYFPVFLILIIRILVSPKEDITSLLKLMEYNWSQKFILIIILLVMAILSYVVMNSIRTYQGNERAFNKLTKNITGEMASFFIPFILSILTINIDWYGWGISAFIFILCGYLVIQADWLHLCPVFFYLGYKLYKDEHGRNILSRLQKEQFNQILMDDINGLDVRALTPSLYITIRNKF